LPIVSHLKPFSPILGNSQERFPSGSQPSGFRLPKIIYTERRKKLRELLKARRKAARLMQTVVANRLSKRPSYVAKYEGGDRRLDVLEFGCCRRNRL
jgi:hypothetical protein